MKQFYETYKDNQKLSPLVTQLSWTNNLLILSASKYEEEREFYLNISIRERYSKRELERQISSGLFERAMLADKKMSTVVKQLPQGATGVFKDSYALSCSLSPTVISDYETQLIPKEVLREKVNEFYALLEGKETE